VKLNDILRCVKPISFLLSLYLFLSLSLSACVCVRVDVSVFKRVKCGVVLYRDGK